jgi:hypothetical protein
MDNPDMDCIRGSIHMVFWDDSNEISPQNLWS